jgi:DNA-binding response OmpR family regulator
VDDDWAITRLIRVNLEDDETQVREVSTGLDCIRVLNEEGADVVLLDLRLPDFSGWGILGLLRLSDSFKNIPVIVVSVEPPDLERMRQFHPDDYIQKPFDIRDLMARVKRVVGQKQGPN